MISLSSFFSSFVRPQVSTTLKQAFHMSASVFSVVKTKQAAAKRMIKTGNGMIDSSSSHRCIPTMRSNFLFTYKGGIKVGHANKSHLNGGKSRKQIRRLNAKVSGAISLNNSWHLKTAHFRVVHEYRLD